MFEETKLNDNLLWSAVQAAESCVKSLKNSITSAIFRNWSKFSGRCGVCGECDEEPASALGLPRSLYSVPLTVPTFHLSNIARPQCVDYKLHNVPKHLFLERFSDLLGIL